MKSMSPIILTENGDQLIPIGVFFDESYLPVVDADTPEGKEEPIGKHSCGGLMFAYDISYTSEDVNGPNIALYCERCGYRETAPWKHISRFGKLRKWCAEQIEEKRKTKEAIERLINSHGVYGPLSEAPLLTPEEATREMQQAMRNARIAIGDIDPEDEPPNHSRFGVPRDVAKDAQYEAQNVRDDYN